MFLIATLGVIYVTGYVAFLKEGLNLLYQNNEPARSIVVVYAILNIFWPVILLLMLIQKAAA